MHSTITPLEFNLSVTIQLNILDGFTRQHSNSNTPVQSSTYDPVLTIFVTNDNQSLIKRLDRYKVQAIFL